MLGSRFVFVLFWAMLCISGGLSASEPKTSGLSGADKRVKDWKKSLEAAYRYNADLRAARAEFQSAQDGVRKAQSEWLPSVKISTKCSHNGSKTRNASSSSEKSNTVGYGAGFRQNLFASGGTTARIRAAKAQKEAFLMSHLNKESEILLECLKVFLEVSVGQKLVVFHQENVQRSKNILAKAKFRFRLGDIPLKDRSVAEANLADAEARLAVVESKLENSVGKFEDLTGCVCDKNLAWPEELLGEGDFVFEALLQEVLKKNFALKRACDVERGARSSVHSDFSHMLPSLDLSANVQQDFEHRESSQGGFSATKRNYPLSAGAEISLSMPISLGGQQASVRQSEQRLSQKKWERIALERRLKSDLIGVLSQIRAAKGNVRRHELELKANRQALDAMQAEFNKGGRALVDMSEIQDREATAYENLMEAKKQHLLQTLHLEVLRGQLTAKYLKLDVTFYDVQSYKPWFSLSSRNA